MVKVNKNYPKCGKFVKKLEKSLFLSMKLMPLPVIDQVTCMKPAEEFCQLY
jgi:hypothetical protein